MMGTVESLVHLPLALQHCDRSNAPRLARSMETQIVNVLSELEAPPICHDRAADVVARVQAMALKLQQCRPGVLAREAFEEETQDLIERLERLLLLMRQCPPNAYGRTQLF